MKKNLFIALAMVVGIFILPAVSLATTFEPPVPVYLWGDASGKTFYKSESSVALDLIEGAEQFCNDTMKERGWAMIDNAFRSSERINPNLLMIQLYQPTLKTQFSFNVKNGELWGLIPSCMLIPDGKTVIVENSAPSLNNNGGHHFSLVAGISDPSYYRVAANIMPCPDGMAKSNVSATTPASAPAYTSPASTYVAQTAPNSAYAPVTVARKHSPAPVKRPRTKKCDPCEEIAKVKTDTEAIRKSVGDVDPAESYDEQMLQNKAKKNLQISKEVKASVGDGKVDESGKVLSLHEKIGEPTTKGETIMDVLKDVQKKVTPPPDPPKKDFGEWWWLVLAVLSVIIVLYLWQQGRRRPLANPLP